MLRSSNQQHKADLILESVMSKLKALPKYIEKIKIGNLNLEAAKDEESSANPLILFTVKAKLKW